jgi:hypothetical protein
MSRNSGGYKLIYPIDNENDEISNEYAMIVE